MMMQAIEKEKIAQKTFYVLKFNQQPKKVTTSRNDLMFVKKDPFVDDVLHKVVDDTNRADKEHIH